MTEHPEPSEREEELADTERQLACACLTDREFDDWALEAWPRLSDAVLESAQSSA